MPAKEYNGIDIETKSLLVLGKQTISSSVADVCGFAWISLFLFHNETKADDEEENGDKQQISVETDHLIQQSK